VIKQRLLSLLIFVLFAAQIVAQQTELFRNPIKIYNLGLEYFDKELYSAAQKQFDEVGEINGNDNTEVSTNAEYFSALCALKLFHRDASLTIREFIRKHPESSKIRDAKFHLGGYYYRKRKWNDVLKWYEQVNPYDLSKNEQYEYKFKMAYSYLMKKDYDKAARGFYEIKDVNNSYSAPSRYYFAHISYLKENYQTALTDFKKLSNHSKFGPIVPYYISQILYNQKKYKELLEYAPPLLNSVISKRRPELARLIGEAYYYERNYEEALPFLETYQNESRVLNNDDRYQLAFTYYKTKDYEKAIKLFVRLSSLNDEMAQISSYHLADCYLKTDQKHHSRSAFKIACDLGFDKEISEESLFNYARLSYELSLNPYQKSINAFKEYIVKYPESSRVDDAYRYLIAVYLTTKNYDAALKSIQSVKNKTPQLKSAYQKIAYNQGIALYQNRDYHNAVRYFDKSHIYKNDEKLTALAYYWKGESRYRQKEFDNAIENYNAFIFQPTAILTSVFNQANYNVGYCHFKKGNYTEANLWLRKFIYNTENLDTFKLNDALLRIGDGYFMLKEYGLAIDFYTQAEKIGSFDADYALFQRAVCEGIKKDYKSKISSLEELIAENPGSTYLDAAYYELGRAYNVEGIDEKALASYKQVIDNGSKNVYLKKSLNGTGLIHYNNDNYDAAIAVFTKMVNNYPTYQDTKEALRVLKNIYLERNEVDKYADLVAGLSYIDVSQNELDSAVFNVAWGIYTNGDCNKANSYFISYLNKYQPAMQGLKANYYLADCYYRSEKYDSAAMYYENIAAMPPNSYTEEALIRTADYYYESEMYEKAYAKYKALEISATSAPNLRQAVGGRLESAFILDSTNMALEAAEVYLGHGFNEANYVAIAYVLKARNAVKNKEYSKAYGYFEIVKDTSKMEISAEATYGLAKINFINDSLKACEKYIYEVVDGSPRYPFWIAKSLILLSDVYVKQEDYFQSKAVLQAIIDNYKGKDLKNAAKIKLQEVEALEKKPDEELKEAPEMEFEFEAVDIDEEDIDALFEEEELEEEDVIIPKNETKEEGQDEGK